MGYLSHPGDAPGGELRDSPDQRRLRHARKVDEGFRVGRYLQPPPMLFTRDGHNVFLGDMYRGQSAFLVCSGPSLVEHDLSQLRSRGFVTLSVNNAATVVPTNLWVSVDNPGNFADVIWRDPAIMKFVPLCHMEKPLQVRDGDGYLVASQELVGDMPAVFGFRRNENFVASQWLYEDTFNWGNKGDKLDELGNKGSRSVFYVALRLLFFLGIRRVYLVGCDFRMEVGKQNYAFQQDRSAGSVRGNNNSYRILNSRLEQLRPHFQREGFEVFNCTPNSGLLVFPHIDFDDAILQATKHLPSDVVTEGMYDRKHARPEQVQANVANHPTKPSPAPRTAPLAPQNPSTDGCLNDAATKPTKARKSTAKKNSRTVPTPIELTIVTTVDESSWPSWRICAASWLRSLNGAREVSWLVGYDPHWRGAVKLLQAQRESNWELIPWEESPYRSQREKTAYSWLAISAKRVRTPWTLFLGASTFAHRDARFYLDRWLTADCRGRQPVLISPPVAMSEIAFERERWNRWADSVGELASNAAPTSMTATTSAPAAPSRHKLGYCLLTTDWLQRQFQLLREHPTEEFCEYFLHACAARRRDHAAAVDPGDCGIRDAQGRLRLLRNWDAPTPLVVR